MILHTPPLIHPNLLFEANQFSIAIPPCWEQPLLYGMGTEQGNNVTLLLYYRTRLYFVYPSFKITAISLILFLFLSLMWSTFFKSLLNSLQYHFCFMFWFFGCKVCGILTSQPGIHPAPPALEGDVLTTGPAPPRKVPNFISLLGKYIYRERNSQMISVQLNEFSHSWNQAPDQEKTLSHRLLPRTPLPVTTRQVLAYNCKSFS